MKKIQPLQTVDQIVQVPGSKSLTQRALITAALADGESRLLGPLASEDTAYTSEALRKMGIGIRETEESWLIRGAGGRIQAPPADLYLGNNGTATRFLASVVSLGQGRFRITGDRRMEERPIRPLMEALRGWGVEIVSLNDTGCPPLEVRAAGLRGGRTRLPEGKSSQYLSSLLLVAPYARQEAELEVAGEVLSKPYVAMTMAVMADFGIMVRAEADYTRFVVPRGGYRAREYQIEGDASSASYFWAAAAVTGGRVTVANVPASSLQGDAVFAQLLGRMGCRVESTVAGITVAGPEELQAIEVDMGDCPDVAPTLAVVASQARGRTLIRNIAHLRIKECDRLHVMATELAKLGVSVEEGADYLAVEGRGRRYPELRGAPIETHNDHRIAMCFAVAGLVVPGIAILGEGCVVKSFPDFWERFDQLYR